jgi:hypothetical protein
MEIPLNLGTWFKEPSCCAEDFMNPYLFALRPTFESPSTTKLMEYSGVPGQITIRAPYSKWSFSLFSSVLTEKWHVTTLQWPTTVCSLRAASPSSRFERGISRIRRRNCTHCISTFSNGDFPLDPHEEIRSIRCFLTHLINQWLMTVYKNPRITTVNSILVVVMSGSEWLSRKGESPSASHGTECNMIRVSLVLRMVESVCNVFLRDTYGHMSKLPGKARILPTVYTHNTFTL